MERRFQKNKFDKWLYGGVFKKRFDDCEKYINNVNLKMLMTASIISIFLGIIFLVVDTFLGAGGKASYFYLAVVIILIIVHLLARFVAKKNVKWVMPLTYLFCCLLLDLAIIQGTVVLHHSVGLMFCVFLFVIPLIVLDKPLRLDFLLFAMTVIYSLLCMLMKPMDVSMMDVIYSVISLVVSVMLYHSSVALRMEEIISNWQMEKEKDKDALTKLQTRQVAELAIFDYMKKNDDLAALMLVDVDNFTKVNDVLGHDEADRVLVVISRCIKSIFRNTDIIARVGGDDFMVFMQYATKFRDIEKKADVLQRVISKELKNEKLDITVSTGVAIYPENSDNYKDLYRRAEIALKRCKRQGKAKYVIYRDRMGDEI